MKRTYEESIQRLEEITSQMEHNEIGIDELAPRLKEAQELIKFCREKLYSADEEIQKIIGAEEK